MVPPFVWSTPCPSPLNCNSISAILRYYHTARICNDAIPGCVLKIVIYLGFIEIVRTFAQNTEDKIVVYETKIIFTGGVDDIRGGDGLCAGYQELQQFVDRQDFF